MNVVDGVVDYGVGVDFHTLALCQSLSFYRRTYLESHDHTLCRRGEHHVVFRYLSYRLEYYVHLYLLCRHLDERVGEGFHRALCVGLYHEVQFVELAESHTVCNLLE